jgi:hypothetical protein
MSRGARPGDLSYKTGYQEQHDDGAGGFDKKPHSKTPEEKDERSG